MLEAEKQEVFTPEKYRFNRLEVAGSLGDLGTLLPIAIAMVLVNGLNPLGLFFSISVFFILSGIYFGVTVPVQPMKVIGAYAIATAMSPDQIPASSLLMGVFLLIVGLTGAIDLIHKNNAQNSYSGCAAFHRSVADFRRSQVHDRNLEISDAAAGGRTTSLYPVHRGRSHQPGNRHRHRLYHLAVAGQ